MKHMIWSNNAFAMDEYLEGLREEDPEMDDATAWATAESMCEDDLRSALADLRVPVGEILVIARLGLWNGTKIAYKTIRRTLANAYDVTCGDYIDWYVEDGEMKIDDTHHDGTNTYMFRAWRDGVDETKKDLLFHLLNNGFDDLDTLNVYTRPLGADVAKIYGWEE